MTLTGAGDATPANVPTTTPDITFSTTTPINFASGSLYTIGEFLASGGGSTILTGSSQLGDTLDNTIVNFVGTVSVTTGQTFTAGHDDGLTLVIDGITVINAPGGTAFAVTTQTYTGPTGTFGFQLVYGECCGAPGDLSISLPLESSTTPEPYSIFLVGGGLVVLGACFKGKSSFPRLDFARIPFSFTSRLQCGGEVLILSEIAATFAAKRYGRVKREIRDNELSGKNVIGRGEWTRTTSFLAPHKQKLSTTASPRCYSQ